MNDNRLTIRQLATMDDLTQMQKVEAVVWEMSPIPLHQTYTTLQNGGIILGAYKGENMIGFSYGFPGFKQGQIYLCSHMLGILPGYQESGIGKQMKLKQAELAREAGFEQITWTFDPLESRNAYLNLHKLGATGAIYRANYYGDMNDGLNKGLPTDRIQIIWDIQEPNNREAIHAVNQANVLLDLDTNQSPIIKWDLEQLDLEHSKHWFAAVPKDFQTIKKTDFELAKTWRLQTRQVFERLFAAGFQATDLVSDKNQNASYYEFTK